MRYLSLILAIFFSVQGYGFASKSLKHHERNFGNAATTALSLQSDISGSLHALGFQCHHPPLNSKTIHQCADGTYEIISHGSLVAIRKADGEFGKIIDLGADEDLARNRANFYQAGRGFVRGWVKGNTMDFAQQKVREKAQEEAMKTGEGKNLGKGVVKQATKMATNLVGPKSVVAGLSWLASRNKANEQKLQLGSYNKRYDDLNLKSNTNNFGLVTMSFSKEKEVQSILGKRKTNQFKALASTLVPLIGGTLSTTFNRLDKAGQFAAGKTMRMIDSVFERNHALALEVLIGDGEHHKHMREALINMTVSATGGKVPKDKVSQFLASKAYEASSRLPLLAPKGGWKQSPEKFKDDIIAMANSVEKAKRRGDRKTQKSLWGKIKSKIRSQITEDDPHFKWADAVETYGTTYLKKAIAQMTGFGATAAFFGDLGHYRSKDFRAGYLAEHYFEKRDKQGFDQALKMSSAARGHYGSYDQTLNRVMYSNQRLNSHLCLATTKKEDRLSKGQSQKIDEIQDDLKKALKEFDSQNHFFGIIHNKQALSHYDQAIINAKRGKFKKAVKSVEKSLSNLERSSKYLLQARQKIIQAQNSGMASSQDLQVEKEKWKRLALEWAKLNGNARNVLKTIRDVKYKKTGQSLKLSDKRGHLLSFSTEPNVQGDQKSYLQMNQLVFEHGQGFQQMLTNNRFSFDPFKDVRDGAHSPKGRLRGIDFTLLNYESRDNYYSK